MKTQNKEEKTDEKKKPVNKYIIFPITVSEWENNEIKSYTIQKAYKDDNGEWQNTQSFSEADLCIVGKILSKI